MSLDAALAGLTLGAAAAPAAPSVEVRVDADGIRGLISAEQAATAFAAVMGADTSELSAYTSVNLSTKSFAPEAARAAARGLERMGALETVHMADMISGITEVDALESLRIVSAAIVASGAAAGVLRSIDLSDNALGEKGLRACSTLLSGATALEKLYLCNNGLSKEACAALAEILLAPLPGATAPRSTTTLTTLNFFNNMSGSGGGVALAPLVTRSPALTDFRLASTRCAAEGFVPLCAALSTCAHLTSLDLSDNTIGSGEGADALAKCVGAMRHARTLRLGDLGLEAEGVAKVCAGILASASSKSEMLALEELDLSFNEIGAEDGARALSALLARTPKLRVLQLECNELSSAGVAIVVAPLAAASHADIASLTLLDNEISSAGALAVRDALQAKIGASPCTHLRAPHLVERSFPRRATPRPRLCSAHRLTPARPPLSVPPGSCRLHRTHIDSPERQHDRRGCREGAPGRTRYRRSTWDSRGQRRRLRRGLIFSSRMASRSRNVLGTSELIQIST